MSSGREHLRTVVLWDLDSTLADTVHRQGMIPAILAGGEGAPTWEDYSMLCSGDTPVAGAVALLNLLYPSHLQHVVTGRSAVAYGLTRRWLADHSVLADHLEMRPAGDSTPNATFKIGYIQGLQAAGYRVILYCEDWPPIAQEVGEATGVPVLGVNPFYPPAVALETVQRYAAGASIEGI
jgi:hypothetical protein